MTLFKSIRRMKVAEDSGDETIERDIEERGQRYQVTATIAKARITRETWGCQPCHERLSLWIEAELLFCCLEAIFYRSPLAFDGDERLDIGAARGLGHEVGQIAVPDITSD